MAKRRSARSILSGPRPGEKPKSRIEQWMRANPDASDFVDEWLRMRAAGETDWGMQAVVNHLREHHGYPFGSARDHSGFRLWLREYRKGEYDRAIRREG